MYEAGRRALSEGNVDVGQDAVSNALAMYEQIYGPVHAIASAKSHSLGIVYHQLYQTIMRKVTTHDVATQVLSEMGPKEREENAVQFAEAMLEDVAAARHEAESYLQSSVRSIRQSLIVTERTLGLDASETCQQYTDLTVLEHGVGNSLLALRLSRHAIDLWASTYGPDHPAILKIMVRCPYSDSVADDPPDDRLQHHAEYPWLVRRDYPPPPRVLRLCHQAARQDVDADRSVVALVSNLG